jgi:hypothetical protein
MPAPTKPDTLCMAPWTHTYLSPQTERRMCCASREPAQNFTQYIDTGAGSGQYIPITLEQHWNSEHMRDVRRRMMAGETLPECEICNNQLLNTNVYRTYFDHLFGSKYQQAMELTTPDGATEMKPVSWDYRFSNLCNFKCRTCGDMLSSSWESEQREHKMVDLQNPKNNWMQPIIKEKITAFQDTVVEQEFSDAVEQHRVEEVYWVGGEPLMYEQHWRYMKRIIELGDGPKIYARYNTNLSRCHYRGIDLFSDILDHVRDYQICASLDGTGPIGEYIRTGLRYDSWLANFRRAVAHRRYSRQVRIDFTLTLPGIFEVENIVQLAQAHQTEILAKVIFSFTPDIILSPLALPRKILDRKLDELIPLCNGAMQDILVQLKTRPTFEEQWPDTYQAGLVKGKRRLLQLENIRGDTYTMSDILAVDFEIQEWYEQIIT